MSDLLSKGGIYTDLCAVTFVLRGGRNAFVQQSKLYTV